MQKTIAAVTACLVLLLAFAIRSGETGSDSGKMAGIDFHRMDQVAVPEVEPQAVVASPESSAAKTGVPTVKGNELTAGTTIEADIGVELDLLSQAGDLNAALPNPVAKVVANQPADTPIPAEKPVLAETAPVAAPVVIPGNTAPAATPDNPGVFGNESIRNPYFDAAAPVAKPVASRFSTNAAYAKTGNESKSNIPAAAVTTAPASHIQVANDFKQSPPANAAKVASSIAPEFAARAMRHVEQGNTLARRGATATAHGEFVQALVTIADWRDSISGINSHNQSLGTALQILGEVRDLYIDNSSGTSVADPAFVVGTHICRVVTVEEAKKMTRTEIVNRYLDGISRQLYTACENDPIAAAALSSLAKLHAIKLNESGTPQECEWNLAMTLFRTAMACNPQDARSANEMGVLFAKVGDHQNAREMLLMSLRIRRTATTWRNLAWLHNQLGEQELAALADQEAAIVASEDAASGIGLVQWIDPQSFGARPEEFDPVARAEATTEPGGVRNAPNGERSLFSNPFNRK